MFPQIPDPIVFKCKGSEATLPGRSLSPRVLGSSSARHSLCGLSTPVPFVHPGLPEQLVLLVFQASLVYLVLPVHPVLPWARQIRVRMILSVQVREKSTRTDFFSSLVLRRQMAFSLFFSVLTQIW